jgi:hypothetical protein
MKLSLSSIEMRGVRLNGEARRLCAAGILVVVSLLLLTLSPQAVYGQG